MTIKNLQHDRYQFLKAQIAGFADLIACRERAGDQVHIVTFMFPSVGNSKEIILLRMRDQVERVYSTYLTHVCRRPLAKSNECLPVLIGSFDLPVFKYGKSSGTSSLNQGLHFHALLVTPSESRLKTSVDEHFADHNEKYTANGSLIQKIHVEKVTHGLARVTDYVLKSITNGRLTYDEAIVILPKARSELKVD